MVSNAAPAASSLSSTLGSNSIIVNSSSVTQISLGNGAGGASSDPKISTISMSLNNFNASNQGSSISDISTKKIEKGKKKLKGGLTLVYAADGEGADEISMEETRALLPRYLKLLMRASSIRNASA